MCIKLVNNPDMSISGLNKILVRLCCKKVHEEKKNRKKMKICLFTIPAVITTVTTWYLDRLMMWESLQDRDQKRRYLNRLYDGSEIDFIGQLRVSKHVFVKVSNIL